MKISILIHEGIKQVIMTPETDHEKNALGFIAPTDTLEVVNRWGSLGDKIIHANLAVGECRGEWLRLFPHEMSLMFVIREKKKEPQPSANPLDA